MATVNGDKVTMTKMELQRAVQAAARSRRNSDSHAPSQYDRLAYAPIWSTELFGADDGDGTITQPRGRTLFFKVNNRRERHTNLRIAGQIPKNQRVEIFRLLPLYWFGTSPVDWAALIQEMVTKMTAEEKKAYMLLAASLQASVGFVGAGLPSFGTPGTQASSLGRFQVDSQETYEVLDELEDAPPIGRPVVKTYQLELMSVTPA